MEFQPAGIFEVNEMENKEFTLIQLYILHPGYLATILVAKKQARSHETDWNSIIMYIAWHIDIGAYAINTSGS